VKTLKTSSSKDFAEALDDAELLVRMLRFMQNNPNVDKDPLVVSGDEYYAMQERTQITAINALNELQGRLKQWQENNFDDNCTGPEWMALGAAEELGEVSHIIVKAKQRIREHQAGLNKESLEKLADGVADTVIYLMQLCSHVGIDFGRALFYTADTVMKRNWKDNKTDGVSK
jgi:NTP pyrophosphatase (non-canonical NTP hydrolase)